MSLQERFEKFKNKKHLISELNLYKTLIKKKRDQKDYSSALEKLKSALILINENQEKFDLVQERHELESLRFEIKSEIMDNRRKFLRRFHGLLNERLTKENLEGFCKLLTMLKVQIDNNLEQLNLHDIRSEINTYFKYIKKLYAVLSSYQILTYNTASNQILRLASELKRFNYPNLRRFTYSLYNELLHLKLNEVSKRHERIKLHKLSQILTIDPENLTELIDKLIKKDTSPIKYYIPKTQEIVFN
ncbi:MAG: hypothetical protein EU516_01550 [Promethearchaeota archaeon]|nr:MAG: hypothetical protein EU516_01550 [Candidatus Lokiarchaeota archaeon]